MALKDWKRTATFGKTDKRSGRKSMTDQWVKGNSLIDLRKIGNREGFVLETFDMKRRRDEIKEIYKTRSQGLRRAKTIMKRN